MRNVVTRWQGNPLAGMSNDFDRMFGDLFTPARTLSKRNSFSPACDIEEVGDHYLISFDLPGLERQEVKVEVQKNELRVSGERNFEQKEGSDSNLQRYERQFGSFSRNFVLSNAVEAEKIEANFENGVLQIIIPKKEAVDPKAIEITSGGSKNFKKITEKKRVTNPESKTA
jgi:HSP20 family protein